MCPPNLNWNNWNCHTCVADCLLGLVLLYKKTLCLFYKFRELYCYSHK